MSDGPPFRNEFYGDGGNFYQGTINIQQGLPFPWDLLKDLPLWTNHTERLDFLMEWLSLPNPSPLVIKGPKGTGKSAMVGVAACRCRHRLPQGVLQVEPRKHGVVAELVAALERFGASRISTEPGRPQKHYHSLLADFQTLVVIDEPRNMREIEAFWPEGSRGRCIVLTTKDLHWPGAHEITMPPLSTEHAGELLAKAQSLTPEVNRELVAAFGGFPGKLLRAAGIIAAGDISIEKLVALAGSHTDERLFLNAFAGINADAQRVYRALCVLPDPVIEKSLLDWLDRSAPDGEEPVMELVDAELVYSVGRDDLWRVRHQPEGTDIGGPND